MFYNRYFIIYIIIIYFHISTIIYVVLQLLFHYLLHVIIINLSYIKISLFYIVAQQFQHRSLRI